jgi:hypothetical protein
MKKSKHLAMRFIPLLLIGILFLGCKKDSGSNNIDKIDVTGQCYKDFAGNNLTNTGVCSGTFFNVNELALFKDMDTVNLNNTAKPDFDPLINIYPNPSRSFFNLTVFLNESFTGKVVLKYVIVDNQLNILQKKYVKNITKGSWVFNISLDLPNGKYRLYMTLSAENFNNFYTLWRNIQIGDFLITP